MAGTFYITTQEKKFSIKVHLRSKREYLDNGERQLKSIETNETKEIEAGYLKDAVLKALANL